MISESLIKEVVEKVLLEVNKNNGNECNCGVCETCETNAECENVPGNIDDGCIDDITEIDIKKQVLIPNPENLEGLMKMKEVTPARIGLWRAGPRYKTQPLLRVRADHAAAMDAVFTYVDEKWIKEAGLFSVTTLCKDKDEFLTRPDYGKKFSSETIELIKSKCKIKPQVQIIIGDGLSSSAVEANAKDTMAAIVQGLEGYGIEIGTPFFIKHARVPSMEPISEALQADVMCLLIGERPGLVTSESMSCYMAYKAYIGMPEAKRTVIANIHKGGTPATEAGAYIAEVLKKMLDNKASGLNLKL
jgi:ethanolamine ammonia-lyase small subunit